MTDRFLAKFFQYTQSQADKIALCGENTEVSYAELTHIVSGLAQRLMDEGLSQKDVVGITVVDEMEHLAVSLGALTIGCAQIVLPTFDNAQLRQTLAERAGVTRLLCTSETDSLERISSLIIDNPLEQQSGSPPAGIPEDPGFIYLQTAGTTGRSNLVPFSEVQLGQQSQRHAEYANERLLRLASVEYNNSKRHRFYSLWNGGTNVFRPQSDIAVPDYCLSQGVTCLDISRMHATELTHSKNAASLAGVKVRTGGSSVPIDIRQSLEQKVTKLLYVRYAATECGAIAMAGPGQHDEDEPVGFPIKGVELEIVNDGEALPAGETGQIRLRAAGMATGYLGEEQRTNERFRDGWFYPGDVGTLREDGQLVVHGRKDDMIILNGVNVFPVEIERALERHPAVRVAAALPIESAAHGQIPVAAVELADGLEITAKELLGYAREKLGLHAPRRVVIMEQGLPRTPQGKIMRREIANEFQVRKSRT